MVSHYFLSLFPRHILCLFYYVSDGLVVQPPYPCVDLPRQWVGMDGNLCNLDSFLGSRLLVYWQCLQVIQHFPALQHFAKHRVLPVQMWRRGKSDEELTSICRWAFICHAHNASCVVPECRPDFVFEELIGRVVDRSRRLGLGVRSRTAALYHEVGYHAVERTAIVEAGGTEGEEVFCRFGHGFAEDLEFDVAARGM